MYPKSEVNDILFSCFNNRHTQSNEIDYSILNISKMGQGRIDWAFKNAMNILLSKTMQREITGILAFFLYLC